MHGAFSGPWIWDSVVAELAGQGVEAVPVCLITSGPDGSFEANVVAHA